MTTTDPSTLSISTDRAGALLDELNDLIALIDTTRQEQATARLVPTNAEMEQAIFQAEHTLVVEGYNEAERRTRLIFGLRDDAA